MIQARRLVKPRYADTAFDGEGARLAGGRWNERGTAVVYVSATLSLAMLELLVHLDTKARAALQLVWFPVSIPDRLLNDLPRLPKGWRREPAPSGTRRAGTHWVKSGTSCVLRVPSVLVPEESNFVLDPNHPDFRRIRIGNPRPVTLDPRLWTDGGAA